MLFSNKHKKKKTIGISVAIVVFLFSQFFSFTLYARPASAAGLPVVDALAAGQRSGESVLDYIGKTLYAVGIGGLINGVSYMTRKVAYDTAKYLGSGGKGQKPLIFTDNYKDYLRDAALDSVASTITDFGKPFGLNLCKPSNIRVQAQLQIGLRKMYDARAGAGLGGPKPSCSWQNLQVADHFSSAVDAGSSLFSLNTLNNAIDVRQTDFGIAFAAMTKVDRLQAQNVQSKLLQRAGADGFKPIKGLISNKIKTPESIIKEEAKSLTSSKQSEITYGQIAGIYGSGAKEILPLAGTVFLNTFISQLLESQLTKGLIPDKPSDGSGSLVSDFYAGNIIGHKKTVEQAFNYLFTAVPTKQIGNYNAIDKLVACPIGALEIHNCVIDERMRDAIERARFGDSVTIREALDQKIIKDLPLYSPFRVADNTDPNCRNKAYCYSNVQKLRKLRVLPLGFELATYRSDPDNPWTLREVMEGFEDCAKDPQDSTKVIYDPVGHPYCHLIDPNWIIRIPETRCESQAVGPQLISPNSPDRRDECADISTCINEGPNGACLDSEYYGYCTKEKNTWHIGNDVCPAQYNTCKTYTDEEGQSQSYLSRTIDFGQCNSQSAGCRAYSLEKKNVGEDTETWVNSGEKKVSLQKMGRHQTMFLNSQVENQICSVSAEGCTAFYEQSFAGGVAKKAEGAPTVYLKKAPDYLGCYDVNPNTPQIDYPTNLKELKSIDAPAQCESFAQICIPEETACQLYTPLNGVSDVPGIIGTKFMCASTCSGYDAFKQEESFFEESAYPKYFIPADAQSCSSDDAGCEEFTNLEGSEDLEYYSEIKYCEKPDGFNQKTFYSWEGDATSGFVLRVHKLLQIDDEEHKYITQTAKPNLGKTSVSTFFSVGSPAYAEDAKVKLEGYYNDCNETSYSNLLNNSDIGVKANEDCRALYDDEGTVYYRTLKDTVTVSSQCRDLRRTNPTFEIDKDISTAEACQNKSGFWSNNECRRCKGGGRYQNGTCVYAAITNSGESKSCSAVASGCRKYTGTAGHNVAEIFVDKFESDEESAPVQGYLAEGGAKTAVISSEAIQVGSHSLMVDAKTLTRVLEGDTKDAIDPKDEDEFYEISFWARGATLNLVVSLDGDTLNSPLIFTHNVATGQNTPASISNDWKQYRFGPVQVTNKVVNPKIVFNITSFGANNTLFLDNVKLSRVSDTYYVVKDSWKTTTADGKELEVPLVCDDKPDDPFPGQALGCRGYSFFDQKGNQSTAYATGFEKLCREEAIGCQPLYDSNNTADIEESEKAHIYKLGCSVGNELVKGTELCTVELNGQEIQNGICEIPAGEKSCLIDHIALNTVADLDILKNAAVVDSSIIIPEDSETPIYLTNRNEFSCDSRDQGCERVALEESKVQQDNSLDYSYNTEVFVRNNPDAYEVDNASILCDEEGVGCSTYGVGNATTYFKDPQKTSNKLCEYRPRVEKDGNIIAGWYRVDLEGDIPCYEKYINKKGEYGIWSNKSVGQYDGFVGQCPSNYDQCTELVDPADTSEGAEGKPYYVIFNDSVQKSGTSECGGQVSLKEGCILFDRTEEPKKSYDSKSTYKKSEVSGFGPVDIQKSVDGNNDTNLLLKVKRDRMCSEWLSCKTSITKINSEGKAQNFCYEFKACDESENGVCTNWVDPEENRELLSEKLYVERDSSWYGEDYTGYSLLNKYPVTHYDHISIEDKSYLVYKQDRDSFTKEEAQKIGCDKGDAGSKPNWTSCGLKQEGRCYEGECIHLIGGSFSSNVTPDPAGVGVKKVGQENAVKILEQRNMCKAFPERSSPFPQSVLKSTPSKKHTAKGLTRESFISKESSFSLANVCQGETDCSCAYIKAEYSGVQTVDYWPFNTKVIPSGVCTGPGNLEGDPCVNDNDCAVTVKDSKGEIVQQSGTCGKKLVEESHLGLTGYCLEYDLSRPINGYNEKNKEQDYACLTWLPIDVSPSGIDNDNFHPEAGYTPSVDAEVLDNKATPGVAYCRRSTNVGDGQYEKKALGKNEKPTHQNYFSLEGNPLCNGNQSFNKQQECGVAGQYNCNTDTKGKNIKTIGFASASCGHKDTTLYGAMLVWSQEDLFEGKRGLNKKNTVILRTEMEDITSLPYVSNSGGSVVVPNSLLPIDRWSGMSFKTKDNCISNTDYQAGGTEGKLIMRHPPRLWNLEEGKENVGAAYFTNSQSMEVYHRDENYYELDYGCNSFTGQVKVSGIGNYPGRIFASAPISGKIFGKKQSVFRSDYEKSLNLAHLKKVYFVPTMYTGGAQGNQPLLLNKELYIDFANLEQAIKDNKYAVENRPVPTFPTDKEGQGGTYTYGDVSLLYLSPESSSVDNTKGRALVYVQTDEYGEKNVDDSPYDADMKELNKKHYSKITVSGSQDTFGPQFEEAAKKAQKPGDRNYISRRYNIIYWYNHEEGPHNQLAWINKKDSNGKYLSDPFEGDGDSLTYYDHPEKGYHGHYDMRCDKRRVIPSSSMGGDNSDDDDNYGPNNWFAIAMDFNEDGEFLGYTSRMCNQSNFSTPVPGIGALDKGNEENGINMTVIAELYDMCTDFVQVHDSSKTKTPKQTDNKAWTDRVWKYAVKIKDGIMIGNRRLDPSLPLRPHGMAKIKDDSQKGELGSLSDFAYMSSYRYANSQEDGYPIACMDALMSGFLFRGAGLQLCNGLTEYATPKFLSEFVVTHSNENAPSIFKQGNELLHSLFAKSLRVVQRNGGLSGWNGDNIEKWKDSDEIKKADHKKELVGPPEDMSRTIGKDLIVPQIYSTNPHTCFEEPNENCGVGEADNVTINQRNATKKDYNGKFGSDEDPQAIGAEKAIIANKTLSSVMSFFAFADHNRMPIKRVMINWDDGDLTNPNTYGRYKNRKPYCDTNDGSADGLGVCAKPGDTTQLTCMDDKDCPVGEGYTCNKDDKNNPRFGNAPRACHDNYFEFVHSYTCPKSLRQQIGWSQTTINTLLANKTLQNTKFRDWSNKALTTETQKILEKRGLLLTDEVCVYKPRVQVLDNWGWCNGECKDAITGAVGCYNNKESNELCKEESPQGVHPWTDYNGLIVVIPKQAKPASPQ